MRITPVGVGVVTYNDDHSYMTLVYSIFTESHEPVLNLESAVEHRIRSAIGSCDGLRDGLGRVEEQPWRGFAHR